jgi:hypothetical protein
MRGVNYSFKGRMGFGIFFRIIWDFLQKGIRDFFRVIYPSVLWGLKLVIVENYGVSNKEEVFKNLCGKL